VRPALVHLGQALAFDKILSGNDQALSVEQLQAAKQFLTLRCSICHNGATFSDGKFHNVALA
jgi:cytochrome c peroxidase